MSPILLYNCEIWGCFLKSVGKNYDKFVSRIFDDLITPENMHNKVCKMALGVHFKANNHAVKGELGRFSLHLIICPLCNRSEIGDEFHYFLKYTHSSLSHIRGIFLESLYSINSNFTNMSCKALFLYIMSMCDENINLSASYIENILNCYTCKLELNFLTIRVA